jgi:hypothetical protein
LAPRLTSAATISFRCEPNQRSDRSASAFAPNNCGLHQDGV